MRQFFKFFLAALLALVVFSFIGILIMFGLAASVTAGKANETGSRAVLHLDLNDTYKERSEQNPFGSFGSDDMYDKPGLYDVVRMIEYAKSDSSVKGIYLRCNNNNNGFAASEEIRNALIDFKKSRKFIYAYGDVIDQKAYYVANVAHKIYANPKGGVEWTGFAVDYLFFKRALDKLEIEPRVFYAGKFKSATEPFRAEKMSDANKLQTQVFLNDLYNEFLLSTSKERNIDTATLHRYANEYAIRTTADAVKYNLIDGARYDDQIKDEIRSKLGLSKTANINFVELGKYMDAVNFKTGSGNNRIALVYAQGDIVDGKGSDDQIGGDTYRNLFRKARFDKSVKAIVVRVNSGGGSALASENMWREIELAKKEKPVVFSFGDYAASGGYYMSCNADSIFALKNTITGSIGVFSLIPNMQGFLTNKLGITFDGVKTATYAGVPSVVKPLTTTEQLFIQNDVDAIYQTFIGRVAAGRKMDTAMVDSIGQGRVWTGTRGIQIGLVDKIGGLKDAVECAARMADLKNYKIKEYPEPEDFFKKLFGNYKKVTRMNAVKDEMGEEGFKIYTALKNIQLIMGRPQAKMPFEMNIK